MSSNQYTRERKEDKPVLAICYDFDKALSPDDMQAQGYIQCGRILDRIKWTGEPK